VFASSVSYVGHYLQPVVSRLSYFCHHLVDYYVSGITKFRTTTPDVVSCTQYDVRDLVFCPGTHSAFVCTHPLICDTILINHNHNMYA